MPSDDAFVYRSINRFPRDRPKATPLVVRAPLVLEKLVREIHLRVCVIYLDYIY